MKLVWLLACGLTVKLTPEEAAEVMAWEIGGWSGQTKPLECNVNSQFTLGSEFQFLATDLGPSKGCFWAEKIQRLHRYYNLSIVWNHRGLRASQLADDPIPLR